MVMVNNNPQRNREIKRKDKLPHNVTEHYELDILSTNCLDHNLHWYILFTAYIIFHASFAELDTFPLV